MNTRILVLAGVLVSALALSLTSSVAEAKDGRRVHLRRQVAELKVHVADIRAQLAYTTRALGEAPAFPGSGNLCSDPCASDSDGVGDCEDFCPCDANVDDADADGIPDCADPCPDDATDACVDPCNFDSDGDGLSDCEDPCAWDPSPAVDTDQDGIPDCYDFCPGDPLNICFEPCLRDQDGDGVGDCDDVCPWAVPSADGSPTKCLVPPLP
jgi:hypothetical protein